eukprot:6236955-Alexandrium_andersonii.AAC.1
MSAGARYLMHWPWMHASQRSRIAPPAGVQPMAPIGHPFQQANGARQTDVPLSPRILSLLRAASR